MTVCEHRNEDKFNLVANYVKEGKTVVIIGTCGSGKTTLFKELLEYTGDDKVLAIGWLPDLNGINRSNVIVKDRHDINVQDDIVQSLAEGGSYRLAYDEFRGDSVYPVLHLWSQMGKGLGTAIVHNLDSFLSFAVTYIMDASKKTVEESTECFVHSVDAIVEMNPRSRDIEKVCLVDKAETSVVKLKSVVG